MMLANTLAKAWTGHLAPDRTSVDLARADAIATFSGPIVSSMRHPLLAVLLCVAVSTSAQSDPPHWRRNEFGLDLTTFFRQFLTWSGSEAPSYYVPAYMLTYRYHFRQWNIRAAIGGDISREDRSTPYDFGPSTYASDKSAIDLRVGAERFSELGRRWQVCYGIDIRTSRSLRVEDAM